MKTGDENTSNDSNETDNDDTQPCLLLPGHLTDGAAIGAPAGEPVVELRVIGHALALVHPRGLFARLANEGVLERDVHYFEFRSEPEQNSEGRPSKLRYLTEVGAVLFVMRARTPLARAMQRQIAHVFVEWRRGRLGGSGGVDADQLERMFKVLMSAIESLGGRVNFLETHLATGGTISRAQHQDFRERVSRLADLEANVAGKHRGKKRAALRSIDNDLTNLVQWGSTGAPWPLMPLAYLPLVLKHLRCREKEVLRDLGPRPRSRQVDFDFPDVDANGNPKQSKH